MNDNGYEKDINEYDITLAGSFSEPETDEKPDSCDVEKLNEISASHTEGQKPKTSKNKKLKSEQSEPGSYQAVVIQKTRSGQTGVCFNGFGISVPTDKPYNSGDVITLEYTGEIGKPDFKCRQV